MRTIPTVARTELPWRPFHVRAWTGGWVIGSTGSEVAILDRRLTVSSTHVADRSPSDLGVDAAGTVLTLADDQGLHSMIIHLVDLADQSRVGELVVDGHPLSTVEQLHGLRGDRTPCTDLRFVDLNDGDVLTTHGESQLVLSRARDWAPEPDR